MPFLMTSSETTLKEQITPPAENSLTRFMNRYATPLTTGLFAVSTISGVALFFHLAPGAFHGMHEWLSIVLLAPVVLHVWKNWRSILSYAKRGTLIIPLVLSLIVALPFAISGMSGNARGRNPAFRAVSVLTQARLADLAPILKKEPDDLLAALKRRGFTVQSADETLEAIAATAGKQASDALMAVLPNR